MRHPEVASRPCAVCLKYEYEDDGSISVGRDEKPVERLPMFPAPCRTDKGCPKGTPEQSKALTPDNERCYEHYLECKAIGQFPDDAVVRRNAAVIREVEENVKEHRRVEFESSVLLQLQGLKG